MINKFRHGISFSRTRRESDVLMEHYSRDEIADMYISDDLTTLYFYLYLPVIYGLGVLVPFTSFVMDILTAVNVTPSQVTPNIWVILRAFQIVCLHLGVSPSFHQGMRLKPIASPYEDWKDKFAQIRGIHNLIMVGSEGEPIFPFSWTPDPKFIVRLYSCVLLTLDREVIYVLECFCPLECSTLITREREDNNRVEECICGMMVVPFDEKWECLVKNQSVEQRDIRSLSRITSDDQRMSQWNPREGIGDERLVDTQPPHELSLWNNSSSDVVAFVDHFFFFPRNFSSDYHMLSTISLTQLSTLLEVQSVRYFLVGKTLREKRSDTLRRMQSR
ncbi:unnamed protein product [Vicia faba]|uniref:Transposase (putative) gypsy type domain-containing protein n=1 Tax=Vicia faba TaxID=3906 RepID=A0AAV1AR02_VICFA|nr:unnamed protein product [Vicia faba]